MIGPTDIPARTGLAELGVTRRLADGDVLIGLGGHSGEMFLVAAGSLAVSVQIAGQPIVLATVGPGDMIGEIAALTGLAHSAQVAATTAVEVVAIPSAAFVGWLDDHPGEAATIAATARGRWLRLHTVQIALELLGDGAVALIPHLLDAAEWIDVPAGHVLFHEDDTPDAAYFVLSGGLKAHRRDRDGVEQPIGDIGRGEVVGEQGIIQDSARSATVRALRDSSLARIPIREFEQMLVDHPQLMLVVTRRLINRLTRARAPRSPSRSVAVINVSSLPTEELIGPFAAAIAQLASCAVATSSTIDESLGRDGLAQCASTDLQDTRVSQHLYELEAGHDHVVYVADAEPTNWSRRVVHHVDQVLAFVSARPSTDDLRRLAAFLDHCNTTDVPRWLVLVDEADATAATAGRSMPVRQRFAEIHHVRRGRHVDLARVARLSVGRGVGLVLGGGGARGFAHIGVIKALAELGVPIDRIGGASMGAIFAAGAARYEDVDRITEASMRNFDRLLDYTLPLVSLLKAKRITVNLASEFADFDIEDLWIPMYCVSTNITQSRLEIHRQGSLVTALRGSVAIPGVLPPVPYGDDLLVDGGVLDNVPAGVMRADPSIRTVIAVDVAPRHGPGTRENYGMYLSGWRAMRRFLGRADRPYPGVGSVLVRTMITGSEHKRSLMRTDGTADLYLDLDIEGVGLLEFHKMSAIVEQGYQASRPQVARWLASAPETPSSVLVATV
jgi:predicted acylesterase/phospholipase RssA/CRP-like cAMP-binding protein